MCSSLGWNHKKAEPKLFCRWVKRADWEAPAQEADQRKSLWKGQGFSSSKEILGVSCAKAELHRTPRCHFPSHLSCMLPVSMRSWLRPWTRSWGGILQMQNFRNQALYLLAGQWLPKTPGTAHHHRASYDPVRIGIQVSGPPGQSSFHYFTMEEV